MQNLKIYNKNYFSRDIDENWFLSHKLPRPDELAAFAYAFGRRFFGDENLKNRKPTEVYIIGCGRGYLSKIFEDAGVNTTGVDPSPYVEEIYIGKDLVKKYEGGGDTIIFNESIEHIPEGEVDDILDKVPKGAWVIITNWLTHHPIPLSGDDHITRIDDEFFDKISGGFQTLYRRDSHLVIKK
jgi:SAM-dependent methyltransferase